MSRLDFGHIPIRECAEPLVLIARSEFVQEPRYFMAGSSTLKDMYLRAGTLDRLRKAQRNLPKGFTLKLWDAFRPRATQETLFAACTAWVRTQHPTWNDAQVFTEARKYIAIPDRADEVPPHNTGGTIDLTLANADGEELDMGTDFDEFGDMCHPFYFHDLVGRDVAEEAIMRNRSMLFDALTQAGFRQDTDEWWHFDYGNQLWALEKNEPYALYGSAEKLLPES